MLTISPMPDAEQTLSQWITDEFRIHAEKHGITCEFQHFAFTAKEGDEVAGVITGHAYFNEAYVNYLVISEKFRGQHLGSRLLETVEKHCRSIGVDSILLTTYDFQAPGFYEKNGFTCIMKRENSKDPRFTKYYYAKNI